MEPDVWCHINIPSFLPILYNISQNYGYVFKKKKIQF